MLSFVVSLSFSVLKIFVRPRAIYHFLLGLRALGFAASLVDGFGIRVSG